MNRDEFFGAKFRPVPDAREPSGYRIEVVEGWSYDAWVESLGIPKTPSPVQTHNYARGERLPRCGAWMKRSKTVCGRREGHTGKCQRRA